MAEEPLPRELRGVTIKEKLGQKLPLNTTFTNHLGQTVRLGDYLKQGKPLMLTLNYFRCTTLCNVQLNSLNHSLRKLQWAPGQGYRMLTISFNHREPYALGAAKRKNYLKALGKGEVDWSFLVGAEAQILKLTRSAGFGFKWDKQTQQYAHPAVVLFISPDGTISRYLYGLEYTPRDLKFAIIDASEGKVGSTVDRIILSCFHYDASRGAYGAYAFGIMRLGGAVTLAALGLLMLLLWRRERQRSASSPVLPTPVETDP